MRVLMLAHTNLPWTQLYARWLGERGDAVRVVSFHPDSLAGVDTVFVGVEPFDKYRNKQVYLTRLPRVRREIRRFDPDVVFATYLLSNGVVAALTASEPIVAQAVGGDVLDHPDHPRWRRLARTGAIRLACARARVEHSVAPHLTRALRGCGVPAEKIVEFPIGVNRARFRPCEGGPDAAGVPVFVCTRSHMPVYDIPTVIEALALLAARGRAFRCRFVAGGDLLEAHRGLARERGLASRVEFTGPLPHERIPDELRAADVYVSAARSDGTSSSLLEAMATGLVPVVTDIEANRPWVAHGVSGLLFPVRDAAALADGLERAAGDVALRARARALGPRRVAERGDLEASLRRMGSLLESAARSARARDHSGT